MAKITWDFLVEYRGIFGMVAGIWIGGIVVLIGLCALFHQRDEDGENNYVQNARRERRDNE